jgi:hypothetical protein
LRSGKLISNHIRDDDDDPFAGGGDDDDSENDLVDTKENAAEITAEEETRVMSMNVSLINKWLWTTPTFFLAACKISWDHHDNYTWKFIFTPLIFYMMYYLGVAGTKGNWLWQDQRDIDKAEKRELQMEAIAKAHSRMRAKKKIREEIKADSSLVYFGYSILSVVYGNTTSLGRFA